LAVRARVRHAHADHDPLLARGIERAEARGAVGSKVEAVLERWGSGALA
jgi:hypothetical protein